MCSCPRPRLYRPVRGRGTHTHGGRVHPQCPAASVAGRRPVPRGLLLEPLLGDEYTARAVDDRHRPPNRQTRAPAPAYTNRYVGGVCSLWGEGPPPVCRGRVCPAPADSSLALQMLTHSTTMTARAYRHDLGAASGHQTDGLARAPAHTDRFVGGTCTLSPPPLRARVPGRASMVGRRGRRRRPDRPAVAREYSSGCLLLSPRDVCTYRLRLVINTRRSPSRPAVRPRGVITVGSGGDLVGSLAR